MQTLDLALVDLQRPTSLVAIAREGRLSRQTRGGSVRVGLAAVDETALALVDLALERGRSITLVYPAPAGDVSVALAAQILLGRFVEGEATQAVGIVTSDGAGATRTWDELAISAVGSRTAIGEVFPIVRAGPDGESPVRRRTFKGVIVGGAFLNWPVDVAVVDHLSGPVSADMRLPAIRIFADPLDPELIALEKAGELIWGWSEADLALLALSERSGRPGGLPFSVATERLATMASEARTVIHAAQHIEAEQIVRRLRDDLKTLGDLAGKPSPPGVMRGIRVAWHHLSTLASLPCRPSDFDRFSGLPPLAARATRTFEPEIAAWARTLTGDLREVGEVVASDLGDLRSVWEDTNPYGKELVSLISGEPGTAVVVRTATAARGFLQSVDDATRRGLGNAQLVAIRRLHREGAWRRAVVVGAPARWDWHRLDSGLSSELHVLVLGDLEAHLARSALVSLRDARSRWAHPDNREKVWRELVGSAPPPEPARPEVKHEISVVDALKAEPEVDPFESFFPLIAGAPLVVGEEGVEEAVAEELATGIWRGSVDAVDVRTDIGAFFLPRSRLVDVRENDQIVERRADALSPGMIILVDRRGGRLGLLEAVSDRLQQERPDLLAADLLIKDLRRKLQSKFAESGISRTQLFERLQSLGFEKTYQAARGYVDEDGPVAPRDFEDLRRLNIALELGMSERRMQEVFAGVRRWRAFRRATGKALVTASRGSLIASDVTRVDKDTGLSIADLQELVLEAEVLDVLMCEAPVAIADIGYRREA